jgi:hypothetical protein
MTRNTQRYERVAQHLSRRRTLGAGAILFASGGMVALTPDPVSASVSVDSLTVPDHSFTSESIVPVCGVVAAYEYNAADRPIKHLALTLAIDGDTVAREELVTDRQALSGETQLSGRITDSEAWSATDFAPEVGATVERTLSVGLTLEVVDTNDSVVVSDSAEDQTTVTVSHPQKTEYVARVGGEGTIRTATPQP